MVANGTDQETAEKEAPILKAAQDMLRKWEAGDEEIVSSLEDYERVGVQWL